MIAELMRFAESAGRQAAVMRYCRSIRNDIKRRYALTYGSWAEYSDRNEQDMPREPRLSVMAAQAVRMRIDEIRRLYAAP